MEGWYRGCWGRKLLLLLLGPCLLAIVVVSPGVVVGVGWVRRLLLLLLDPWLLVLAPVVVSLVGLVGSCCCCCSLLVACWGQLGLVQPCSCYCYLLVTISSCSPGWFLGDNFSPISSSCILLVVAAVAHICCPCHLPHGCLSSSSLSIGLFLLHCHPSLENDHISSSFTFLTLLCLSSSHSAAVTHSMHVEYSHGTHHIWYSLLAWFHASIHPPSYMHSFSCCHIYSLTKNQ